MRAKNDDHPLTDTTPNGRPSVLVLSGGPGEARLRQSHWVWLAVLVRILVSIGLRCTMGSRHPYSFGDSGKDRFGEGFKVEDLIDGSDGSPGLVASMGTGM